MVFLYQFYSLKFFFTLTFRFIEEMLRLFVNSGSNDMIHDMFSNIRKLRAICKKKGGNKMSYYFGANQFT